MMNISRLSKQISSREDLQRYGGTPLGVLAMQKGIIKSSDNYGRRKRLVREFSQKWGEFAVGLYHACNGVRKARQSAEYTNGYTQGRNLLSSL